VSGHDPFAPFGHDQRLIAGLKAKRDQKTPPRLRQALGVAGAGPAPAPEPRWQALGFQSVEAYDLWAARARAALASGDVTLPSG
jgi:hypothetical protein